MAGAKPKFVVELSKEQREKLEAIVAARTAAAHHQERAKVLLMRADGRSYVEIEKAIGVSAPTISKIVKKFHTLGLDAALEDLSRSGRPSVIGMDAKAWVVSLACNMPEKVPGAPKTQQWTINALASYVRDHCEEHDFPELKNVQKSTVWSILNDRDIKPHRIQYYLVRKDPLFEHRAKQVLLVYKRVSWILQMTRKERATGARADEMTGEAFVSYDEKPGIQAVSNIAPDLPPKPKNGTLARDYEYRRHGTVSLLAGIDLLTGEVHGIVRDKHTSTEFVEVLKLLNEKYAEGIVINIILDNHSVHTSEETMNFLAAMPEGRFRFIFTPTHASWLNIIESFFSKLARQALRNLRVKSKEDLKERIESWLEEVNREPVVFRWEWKLEDIEGAFKGKKDSPPTATYAPR